MQHHIYHQIFLPQVLLLLGFSLERSFGFNTTLIVLTLKVLKNVQGTSTYKYLSVSNMSSSSTLLEAEDKQLLCEPSI